MNDEQTLEQLWQRNAKAVSLFKAIHRLHQGCIDSDFVRTLLNRFAPHAGACATDDSRVIVTPQLNSAVLKALIVDQSACAIHVPGFCAPSVAERLSQQALMEHEQWVVGGVMKTDMFYAGASIPGEVAMRSWPEFQRYFSQRDEFVRKQRDMSGGDWPVDRLRLALDDAWPYGAHVGEWLGKKSRPAIMRIMTEETNAQLQPPSWGFIHTDATPKLRPWSATLSANIYLKVPPRGGALYIWSVNFSKTKGLADCLRALLYFMANGNPFDLTSQHALSKLLPKPNVIKPQPGDLVILNSGRPHAVEPVAGEVRATNQLFIQADGRRPLVITS